MLRYLLFILIGIILYLLVNNFDRFSIGIPFNIDDKVVINVGLFLERTGIRGNIQQRTGFIRGIHADGRFIVYYENPNSNIPSTLFDYFDEAQLTRYHWTLYIPPRYRRVCAARE